jgi:hypothetical protein
MINKLRERWEKFQKSPRPASFDQDPEYHLLDQDQLPMRGLGPPSNLGVVQVEAEPVEMRVEKTANKLPSPQDEELQELDPEYQAYESGEEDGASDGEYESDVSDERARPRSEDGDIDYRDYEETTGAEDQQEGEDDEDYIARRTEPPPVLSTLYRVKAVAEEPKVEEKAQAEAPKLINPHELSFDYQMSLGDLLGRMTGATANVAVMGQQHVYYMLLDYEVGQTKVEAKTTQQGSEYYNFKEIIDAQQPTNTVEPVTAAQPLQEVATTQPIAPTGEGRVLDVMDRYLQVSTYVDRWLVDYPQYAYIESIVWGLYVTNEEHLGVVQEYLDRHPKIHFKSRTPWQVIEHLNSGKIDAAHEMGVTRIFNTYSRRSPIVEECIVPVVQATGGSAEVSAATVTPAAPIVVETTPHQVAVGTAIPTQGGDDQQIGRAGAGAPSPPIVPGVTLILDEHIDTEVERMIKCPIKRFIRMLRREEDLKKVFRDMRTFMSCRFCRVRSDWRCSGCRAMQKVYTPVVVARIVHAYIQRKRAWWPDLPFTWRDNQLVQRLGFLAATAVRITSRGYITTYANEHAKWDQCDIDYLENDLTHRTGEYSDDEDSSDEEGFVRWATLPQADIICGDDPFVMGGKMQLPPTHHGKYPPEPPPFPHPVWTNSGLHGPPRRTPGASAGGTGPAAAAVEGGKVPPQPPKFTSYRLGRRANALDTVTRENRLKLSDSAVIRKSSPGLAELTYRQVTSFGVTLADKSYVLDQLYDHLALHMALKLRTPQTLNSLRSRAVRWCKDQSVPEGVARRMIPATVALAYGLSKDEMCALYLLNRAAVEMAVENIGKLNKGQPWAEGLQAGIFDLKYWLQSDATLNPT